MIKLLKKYFDEYEIFPRRPDIIAEIINLKFKDKRIVLYGGGTHSDEVIQNLENKNVTIIDDSNSNYISLNDFLNKKIDYDYIVISSHYYAKQMEERLKAYIDKDKILNLYSLKYSQYFDLDLNKKFSLNNNYEKDTVLIIPPAAKGYNFDFSIKRLIKYLESINKKVICVSMEKMDCKNFVEADNLIDLIIKTAAIPKEIIFYRGWMHSYNLGAVLSRLFDNVYVYLKDWNFSNKEEYKFLFGDDKDFEAVEDIFKYSKKVLSHYTDKQAKIWAEKYKVDVEKFVFFPEYCDNLDIPILKKRMNKLVWAGTIPPSCLPSKFFISKQFLEVLPILKKQKIYLDLVLPEKYFQGILDKKEIYMDFLYENKFNPYFSLKKGKNLDPSVINEYKYGIFPLYLKNRNEELFRYAVPSKFAFYLEANLPIIVNKKMKAVAEIVKKENIGIVISNKDVKSLKKILEKQDYDRLVENVLIFKKKYTFKGLKWINC